LVELVGVQRQRHRIEEVFEAGNGEAGAGDIQGGGGGGGGPPPTFWLFGAWGPWRGGARGRGGETRRDRGGGRGGGVATYMRTRARPGPRRRSRRRSRGCCGVARNRGSTTGTRRGGSSRHGDRKAIRVEQLCNF